MTVNDILEEIAPGVWGYTVLSEGATYIPIIIARPPSKGHVSRYLDSLANDKTWKVPNVMNPILVGMLERRGFHLTQEYDDKVFHSWVPVYVREATHGL